MPPWPNSASAERLLGLWVLQERGLGCPTIQVQVKELWEQVGELWGGRMNEACRSAQKINKAEETHPRQRVCHQNVNLAKHS